MPAWNQQHLQVLAASEELEIAPVRAGGDLRKATPIWVVRDGDDLYVRAASAEGTGWQRAARASRRARIHAGGIRADVAVQDVTDPALLSAVDAAYRSKYAARYASIVERITDDAHRVNTMQLTPRVDD